MGRPTRHPSVPVELAEAVEEVAREAGLRVGYDTHHNAGNVDLSWWVGKTLNRLDLQPSVDEGIQVTFVTDTYPYLPKLLRALWAHVPLFPYAARTEWRVLGAMEPKQTRAYYSERVRALVAGARKELPGFEGPRT